jgi:hypothetical protein
VREGWPLFGQRQSTGKKQGSGEQPALLCEVVSRGRANYTVPRQRVAGSDLEDARASGVDGDLAVALALELDAAVRAPEALADEEPLAVAEDAVTLRHDDGWWWWWWW